MFASIKIQNTVLLLILLILRNMQCNHKLKIITSTSKHFL